MDTMTYHKAAVWLFTFFFLFVYWTSYDYEAETEVIDSIEQT